jgi:hypothetical protein
MNITSRFAVVSAALLLTSGLQAADPKAKGKGTGMDAQMQEMMKKMAPGEQHQVLSPLVGRFTTTSKMWMKPGDKAQESKGTSENTWAYGNRFVKMEMKGDMGGQPFEGVGYLGYDNTAGEYTGVWISNMNTGIARSTGKYDPATKTLTEQAVASCPMTGEKEMRYRQEWKITDNDNMTFTMYGPGPDGKEMKMMESVSKRVK